MLPLELDDILFKFGVNSSISFEVIVRLNGAMRQRVIPLTWATQGSNPAQAKDLTSLIVPETLKSFHIAF